MKFSEFVETVRISYDSVKANKLRSFLASLGVVIGIGFVVIMGWALSGLDSAMQDTFNIIGTDMLYIDKWDWSGGKNWKDLRQRKPITIEEVNRFREKMTEAQLTFPSARNWGESIQLGSKLFSGITMLGTTIEHSLTPAGEVVEGRYFSQSEQSLNANVLVIGYKVYETLFPNGDAIGQTVKINGHKFLVIGVIKKQGTMFFDFIDNQVFMPIGTFLSVFGDYGRSISIGVKAGSEENLDNVRDEARGWMRIIRNVQPWEEDDFSINETKAFESQVAQIRLAVWGVGLGMTVLSFIVGMIGIMNIMFVSVTERTKEIGIRKAIGAKNSSVLLQFIVEAAFLCLIGALLSIVLSSVFVFAAATLLAKFVHQLSFLKPFLPVNLIVIATLVSIVVGVIAGFIPAYRASRLDPVESLRYE